MKDEFLSEEDLDLVNLSWEERIAYWNLWLQQAQATNHLDKREYTHGVMVGYLEPENVHVREVEEEKKRETLPER